MQLDTLFFRAILSNRLMHSDDIVRLQVQLAATVGRIVAGNDQRVPLVYRGKRLVRHLRLEKLLHRDRRGIIGEPDGMDVRAAARLIHIRFENVPPNGIPPLLGVHFMDGRDGGNIGLLTQDLLIGGIRQLQQRRRHIGLGKLRAGLPRSTHGLSLLPAQQGITLKLTLFKLQRKAPIEQTAAAGIEFILKMQRAQHGGAAGRDGQINNALRNTDAALREDAGTDRLTAHLFQNIEKLV